METRQGKIEEKSLAYAKNSAPYATFVISGKKYNTFDQKIIDGFNIDDFVEFTGEQRGAFWTLQTMKKIDELASGSAAISTPGFMTGPTLKTNGTKEYHLSPEEVKCRALESANEHVKGIHVETTELLKLADNFVEWIYGN